MKDAMIEKVGEYEHILMLHLPFDKRNPDPAKNYGIHGMEIRMVVRRADNCTQFLAYLPVYLPHVASELWEKRSSYNPFTGMGADVGYHATAPQYEGQSPMDSCDLLKDGEVLLRRVARTVFDVHAFPRRSLSCGRSWGIEVLRRIRGLRPAYQHETIPVHSGGTVGHSA